MLAHSFRLAAAAPEACAVRCYSSKAKVSLVNRGATNIVRVSAKAAKPGPPKFKSRFVSPSTYGGAVSMASRTGIRPQTFDHFLVLDFEATCENNTNIQPYQEIIEFPVILLDGATFEQTARFHHYIRPQARPDITPFCSQLTGIIQEMVDGQPSFSQTLTLFERWLLEQGLVDSSGQPVKKFTFITCGDWDLGIMLPSEAAAKGVALPSYFSQWINVKKSFAAQRGHFAISMRQLINELHLTHTGRLHSGIDDTENIAAIARALADEGHVYRPNGSTDGSVGNRF